MSPTRFEQFLLDDYPDWYRLEFQKRADRLYQGEIEEVESTVSGHLNIALSKYEKAQTDLQSVEETLAGSLAEIEAQQETVSELEQQRKELHARETELEQWVTASGGVTPASVKIKMRFATGLENQIEAVESALKIEKDRLNAMERQQRLTMRRLEQLKDEVDQLKGETQTLRDDLNTIKQYHRNHRQSRLEQALERCVLAASTLPIVEKAETDGQATVNDQIH